MKEEMMNQEIEHDIELHENILQEIFDNWDQWQNEEYEREFMALTDDTNENQIFCPVCLKNLLNLKENIISCNCGLRFVRNTETSSKATQILIHFQTLLPKIIKRILRDHFNEC